MIKRISVSRIIAALLLTASNAHADGIPPGLEKFLDSSRARVASMLLEDSVLLAKTHWKKEDLNPSELSFDLQHIYRLERVSRLEKVSSPSLPPNILVPICISSSCEAVAEIQNSGENFSLISVGMPLLSAQLAADRNQFQIKGNELRIVESHEEGMRFLVRAEDTDRETWFPLGEEARQKVASHLGSKKPPYTFNQVFSALHEGKTPTLASPTPRSLPPSGGSGSGPLPTKAKIEKTAHSFFQVGRIFAALGILILIWLFFRKRDFTSKSDKNRRRDSKS